MSQFDRAHMVCYYCYIVAMALSCTFSHIQLLQVLVENRKIYIRLTPVGVTPSEFGIDV